MFKLSMEEFAILDVHHYTYNELNADKILLNLQERIIFLNKFIVVRIISSIQIIAVGNFIWVQKKQNLGWKYIEL